MSRLIHVPTQGTADWQRLLADPGKQWRVGFSARTLASCWEEADGLPPEVAALFAQSGAPAFQSVELLLALPERQVAMPPAGGHPSQNDLFALAKALDGHLVAMTIEGKVSEPFGPTLGRWNAHASRGKTTRLQFIRELLGLPEELPASIRYQLLHRTASAVLEAQRFGARYAAVLVHSFSAEQLWFDEFSSFLALFGVRCAQTGQLVCLQDLGDVTLYAGWACGDTRFLRM
jgi:hypothetical protein